jgi:hypothetical protein
MATKQIPLKSINLNPKIHTRVALNPSRVDWFAKLLAGKDQGDGPNLPPVIAYFDGTTYWIADGYHRCHAHNKSGKETIEAIVHKGGAREAFLAGLAYDQGTPKTREDKRNSVLKALEDPELSKWSDRVIARHCGVDHKTVGKLRSGSTGEFPSSNTVGADGKSRPRPPKNRAGTTSNVSRMRHLDSATPRNDSEQVGEPEIVTVDKPSPEEVQADPFDELEDSGPPIDLSDPIFEEDEKEADPELLPGRTPKEVIALSGLPKPLNWKGDVPQPKLPPEEPLKVLVIKMTGEDAGEVIEVAEGTIWDVMKRYEMRDGLRFACGVGVRKGQKVGHIWEDEPEEYEPDPLRAKRDALPVSWVETLYEIQELGGTEARILNGLRHILSKIRGA